MVNHQLGHPAINADILSGNESSLIRAKEHNHICDIHRIADATDWLLQGIRTFIYRVSRIDPSRGNRVHPDLPREAGSHRGHGKMKY